MLVTMALVIFLFTAQRWMCLVASVCLTGFVKTIHSSKSCKCQMIRQGLGKHQRGLQGFYVLTGFYLRRVAAVHLIYELDVSCEMCKRLTK